MKKNQNIVCNADWISNQQPTLPEWGIGYCFVAIRRQLTNTHSGLVNLRWLSALYVKCKCASLVLTFRIVDLIFLLWQ